MLTIFSLTRLISKSFPSTVETAVRWRWIVTFPDGSSDTSSTCARTLSPPNAQHYLLYICYPILTSATDPIPHQQPSSPHYSYSHIRTACTTYSPHRPYHLPRACAESCNHAALHCGWSTIVSCMEACMNKWKNPPRIQVHTAGFHQRIPQQTWILHSSHSQDTLTLKASLSSAQILCCKM